MDASTTGLGAVLSQIGPDNIERPCAYASTCLSESDSKKAPFHLEHQAMVWGCKHFKPYLAGRHFVIRTDHKPLVALNKTHTNNLERLNMELQEFQPFTIKYIKGTSMPADGLSRQVETLSVSLNINHLQILDLQKQDVQAKALAIFLTYNQLPSKYTFREFLKDNANRFVLKNQVLGAIKNDKFVVYAPRTIRETLLRLAHDDKLAGHCGVQKMLLRLKQDWLWPSLEEDATIYCRSCHECNTGNVMNN